MTRLVRYDHPFVDDIYTKPCAGDWAVLTISFFSRETSMAPSVSGISTSVLHCFLISNLKAW